MTRAKAALAALVFPLALGGCTQAVAGSASPTSSTVAAVAPVTTVQGPDPREITIPRIEALSSLIPTGIYGDGRPEVPPVENPEQASWLKPGPEPGEAGPATIYGHVNGGGKPGIFARLTELQPGDEVEILRVDNTIAIFRVERTEQMAKDGFRPEAVYEPTERPELRLVTCGGEFDTRLRSYRDNVVVFAVLDRVVSA